MNEYQKQRFSKRIISCLFNNLTGKKIAVLGFAFKKGTSDTRESPAITLVSNFIAERANVAIYDPKVEEQHIWTELVNDGGSLETLQKNVEVCSSAYTACAGADAVVVVTEWDEFSNKTKPASPTYATSPTVLSEVNQNRTLKSRSLSDFDVSSTLNSLPASKKENNYPSSQAPIAEESLQSALDATRAPPDSKLDWARIAKGMRKPSFVFDGRNILDARKLEQLGFHVEAIGRASAAACNLHD